MKAAGDKPAAFFVRALICVLVSSLWACRADIGPHRAKPFDTSCAMRYSILVRIVAIGKA